MSEFSYPSAQNVLGCGLMGETPAAILLLTPSFELVVDSIGLVTVFVATTLFAMNIVMAAALIGRSDRPAAVGGASFGTLSALLVNCPA